MDAPRSHLPLSVELEQRTEHLAHFRIGRALVPRLLHEGMWQLSIVGAPHREAQWLPMCTQLLEEVRRDLIEVASCSVRTRHSVMGVLFPNLTSDDFRRDSRFRVHEPPCDVYCVLEHDHPLVVATYVEQSIYLRAYHRLYKNTSPHRAGI